MSARVIYDCTRLIDRSNNVTPTGIDRVDIHYLDGLLKNNEIEVAGILQVKGKFLMINIDRVLDLHSIMYGKWIDNSISDEDFKIKIKEYIENLTSDVKKIKNLIEGRIDSRIVAYSKSKISRPAYINTTFSGVDDVILHSALKKIAEIKMVYFVHDLLPIEYPEYFWPEWNKVHYGRFMAISLNGDLIVAVSKDVKNKLEEAYVGAGIQACPVVAIQNGVEDIFIKSRIRSIDDYNPENQFTIVSTIEPRKNHLLLLNVWRDLINSSDCRNKPKLVIIGSRGWHNQNTFDFIDKADFLKQYVQVYSNVSDDFMLDELRKSKAALFPSFGEGWGLPIVEAMSIGIPTICADIPVHRESSQGLAEYLSPIDGLGWRKIINEYSNHSKDMSNKMHINTLKFKPIEWSESCQHLVSHLVEMN